MTKRNRESMTMGYVQRETLPQAPPIVVSDEAFDELSEAIANPRPPTPALIELFRDGADPASDVGLAQPATGGDTPSDGDSTRTDSNAG